MVGMVKVSNPLDWETYRNVRHWVFCVENNMPASLQMDEFDTLTGSAEHFLICDKGLPHGAFRCHPEGDVIHLQWLCVLKHFRREGLARAALDYVRQYYSKKGFHKVMTVASFSAVPFFEKCGCRTVSETFEKMGLSLVKMEMDLENG